MRKPAIDTTAPSLVFCLVLTSLALFSPVEAFAQPQFQHIVIVVQENRSPDNLFSTCGIPGADTIRPSGGPTKLNSQITPTHTHETFLAEVSGKWKADEKKYVSDAVIAPYCNLGNKYGFANRMFQTNQGPSLPAHQFIFGGTSIPGSTQQYPYDNWFVSENTLGGGCATEETYVTTLIDPQTGEETKTTEPCFERATLTDLLQARGLTWRYYAASSAVLWDAPVAIQHICGTIIQSECRGTEMRNVIINPPQILTDITSGTLANVSWVTPAASYSDHPGDGDGGPSWVASIVNAVGQSSYWHNTAVLVVWDDWGGWYDHVAPLGNHTGWCTNYCYGFRVPMLVISAYTSRMTDNTVHDFGSILRFVETNFSLPRIGPGTYADAYADNLGEFFRGHRQQFTPIKTKYNSKYFLELNDHGDPDDY